VELGKKLCESIVPLVHDPALAKAATSSLRGALQYLAGERAP
jgi:hypothetical protein